jgi:hypothetical protein
MAQAFLVEPSIGFSANLPFEDPATFQDSKLEGAGVLIGTEIGSPSTRYTGHLLLRNTATSAFTASPVLQRGTFQHPLGALTLQPGEAREIIVTDSALPDNGEGAGIEITHDGAPGDLLGYWFSVDPTGNLVVETPLRSAAPDERGGGNNPWSLEGDSSAVVYVKNTGTKAGQFLGIVWYPGGQYVMGLKQIGSGETVAIDIRKLRDEQVRDVHGRTLPPDLMSGQMEWRWRGGPP